MINMYSVPLTTLVDKFKLEVAYAATDYEKIRVTVADLSRPGLQLAGYFDHFEPMRLMVMGNVEISYLQKLTPDERAITLDRLFSYKFPALLIARNNPVDPLCMEMAAKQLEGEHDFAAFCGNPKFKKSTVRYIRSVELRRFGDELRISFTGNGFIHNQVRIMVGTLIEVGRGERSAESISLLFGGKRSDAGFLAPAQGLCLMEVSY